MLKNVSPNKDIMWGSNPRKSYHFHVKIGDVGIGQEKLNSEIVPVLCRASSLLGSADPASLKTEAYGERHRDGGFTRPGIELGGDKEAGTSLGIANPHLESGPILYQLIDRLADRDLGPTGFFVIGHRGSSSNA